MPSPEEGEYASDKEQERESVRNEDLKQHEAENEEQEEPPKEIVRTQNNMQQNNAEEQD